MPKIIDLMLDIVSISGDTAIILGTHGGPGVGSFHAAPIRAPISPQVLMAVVVEPWETTHLQATRL